MRNLKGKIEKYPLFCPVCGESVNGFYYEEKFIYVNCKVHGCFKSKKLIHVPMELRVY